MNMDRLPLEKRICMHRVYIATPGTLPGSKCYTSVLIKTAHHTVFRAGKNLDVTWTSFCSWKKWEKSEVPHHRALVVKTEFLTHGLYRVIILC